MESHQIFNAHVHLISAVFTFYHLQNGQIRHHEMVNMDEHFLWTNSSMRRLSPQEKITFPTHSAEIQQNLLSHFRILVKNALFN